MAHLRVGGGVAVGVGQFAAGPTVSGNVFRGDRNDGHTIVGACSGVGVAVVGCLDAGFHLVEPPDACLIALDGHGFAVDRGGADGAVGQHRRGGAVAQFVEKGFGAAAVAVQDGQRVAHPSGASQSRRWRVSAAPIKIFSTFRHPGAH